MPNARAAELLARVLGPWVREVDRTTWRADLLAGLLGAVLVLPQAIAFAALVGVPPAMGLATAVLPCLVAALAGSSRQVLSGPTNATSLALGAMLLPLAGGDPARTVALALMLTLLVGLMQLLLALTRLGAIANFISPSVMLGFTGGAALLIAWTALGQVLGASGRASPIDALRAGVVPAALAIGGVTLALALLLRRLWPRGPTVLLALLGSIALTALIEQRGGLLGSHAARLGEPPIAWLGLHWPPLDVALLPQLLPMALALTIIALGQSISIAKVLAARSGQALDANRECFGQGLANSVGAFAGCFVACGSLNRSLPNLEAGARTPLAGASAALWLLALVALAGPLLAWVPLAGVGALLLVVAFGLVDRAGWRRLWRLDRPEFGIAAATLLATLTLRLEIAILAGVMLSLVAYLYRSARPALRTMGFDRQGHGRPFVVIDHDPPDALPECPQLKLLRMEGSVWFGAVPHVAEHLRGLREGRPEQRHLLVMAKSMNSIDLAAADLWDDERIRRREAHGDLYFHRPRPQVIAMWQHTGFTGRLGAHNVFADKHSALAHIVLHRLDDAVCAQCSVRLFDECSQRPGAPLAPTI
ncbi:SulP family inorganic anion transporter [Aquincola sp. S2]|uniref:SulP family inorganic anion transporter n=1 Tax=Pseudaquabacterium terrae TaxID=2732868 RepID=A0ABX2EB04_9BURK|nr:SulP family inorganic anion transporter [Aquabacterium terrae]NRF66053.1 SulP family inorganic anion transporter [Aquabacterium terrae]